MIFFGLTFIKYISTTDCFPWFVFPGVQLFPQGNETRKVFLDVLGERKNNNKIPRTGDQK